MLKDRKYRVISYHDTWIAIDPIVGCPYICKYCVLRHRDGTGKSPKQMVTPQECINKLRKYPLFVMGSTPLTIGCETDICHPKNVDYLINLISEMRNQGIDNPIVLVTKSPLTDKLLATITAIPNNNVIFVLTYSGLGRQFEPNFTDEHFRKNFHKVNEYGFPIIHFWRPLLPVNTTIPAIEEMIKFVSSIANATVFIGLKLNPELTKIITDDGVIQVPDDLRDKTGEWITKETIELIYSKAKDICPDYSLYRHTSCALSNVLHKPNHTATMYRQDICPPSQCSNAQRLICNNARHNPTNEEINEALNRIKQHREIVFQQSHKENEEYKVANENNKGEIKYTLQWNRNIPFCLYDKYLFIEDIVTQQEFAFLLHNLKFPLKVLAIEMQNIYDGSIYEGQYKAYR